MKYENPMCYMVKTAVAAGATTTPKITISSDMDFELFEMRGNVQTQGAILVSPSYANGQTWTNAAFDSALISAGAGANNHLVMPFPILIPRNTDIEIQLTNTTGGSITYELQLWGRKVDRQ